MSAIELRSQSYPVLKLKEKVCEIIDFVPSSEFSPLIFKIIHYKTLNLVVASFSVELLDIF